jgi:NAD(P)-dependent dehydrogenase (short-subunit alcohol dehydrogenase family)
MQLSGSSAVVVGGTGGMGEATARRLHAAGVHVVIADVNDDKGKALEAELGVRYLHTDAGSEEDVNAAFAAAAEQGPVRVCVDVHGGPAGGGRLLGKDGSPHSLDAFRLTLESYLISPFNVLRLAAAAINKSEPYNEDGSKGVIIQTASIAGFEGQIGQDAYGASKGGIIALTLIAARDLGAAGIRVNAIAPGLIRTGAYGDHADHIEAALASNIPHPKRMGHADDYAKLAIAVAENDYLNGEVIRLDGGLRFPPK